MRFIELSRFSVRMPRRVLYKMEIGAKTGAAPKASLTESALLFHSCKLGQVMKGGPML